MGNQDFRAPSVLSIAPKIPPLLCDASSQWDMHSCGVSVYWCAKHSKKNQALQHQFIGISHHKKIFLQSRKLFIKTYSPPLVKTYFQTIFIIHSKFWEHIDSYANNLKYSIKFWNFWEFFNQYLAKTLPLFHQKFIKSEGGGTQI